jgi:putative addiction module component (TIGR02574 family)
MSSHTLESLLTSALDLPDAERLELVEALITSLQPPDEPALDDSRHEVIARRSEDIAAGRVTLVPWDEVRRSARR